MITKIEYEVPTWNQIYTMLLNIAQKIQSDNYKPDIIVGIARGGLVPTRVLTDLLEGPELAVIQIKFYVDIAKTKQEPTLKQALQTPILGKKALLVDDISDTGRSLKLAKTHLQTQGAAEIRIATLYANKATETMPDYCEKLTDSWIVFPWDAKETVRKIVQKNRGEQAVNAEIAKLLNAGFSVELAQRFIADIQET